MAATPRGQFMSAVKGVFGSYENPASPPDPLLGAFFENCFHMSHCIKYF